MNQLKIDISYNYNDVVKINDNKILDLNKIATLNNFIKLNLFDINLDNTNLFEKKNISVPIFLEINNKKIEKILNFDVNCYSKEKTRIISQNDLSQNDVSQNQIIEKYNVNVINIDFGFTFNLNLENIKYELIPEIISSKYKLEKFDLKSDDLPVELMEWKNNNFPINPLFELEISDNVFFYCWMIPYNIGFSKNHKFNTHTLCYCGEKIDYTKINLFKILRFANMKKNYSFNFVKN